MMTQLVYTNKLILLKNVLIYSIRKVVLILHVGLFGKDAIFALIEHLAVLHDFFNLFFDLFTMFCN